LAIDDWEAGIEALSDSSQQGKSGVSSPVRATAAIRFRIAGPAALLSHAETLRVFQRACARAEIPVRYTEGFNPHPRLSLPLPRPVGVESEDELLVARLYEDPAERRAGDVAGAETAVQEALAGQLPEGIEVLAVTLAASNASFTPQSARYVLPVRVAENPPLAARLEDRIAKIMAGEHCVVERSSGEGKASRRVDVRPFLRSIRLEEGRLIVEHRTGDAGSIRVDEILQLCALRMEDLAGPVRRDGVVWEITKMQKTIQPPRPRDGAEEIEDGTRDVD
jgi:radical SAM-linked protein